jgi:(E)-4-hydroxy-3-methylbut-2-enyl-diphosphate synthase
MYEALAGAGGRQSALAPAVALEHIVGLQFSERPSMYLPNRLRTRRFATRTVQVGDLAIGGGNPIRIQSMTTSATRDVEATLAQVRRLAEAGCELVRLTVPTAADAAALPAIRRALDADGLRLPLCADIHFSPRLAIEAARHVEKVRINPGNFSGRPGRDESPVDEAEYERGRDAAREAFRPLLQVLRQEGRALRIGVNHGSLAQRMVHRWGDTTTGMVESALEYIRFCEEEGYREIVVSMKASSVRVMIYAYRELVARMRDLELAYPLHLGVTEAGGGVEGILKSAQGIGALLEDGLGDTIRVSLTDPPEVEVGPARQLAGHYGRPRRDSRLAYPECGHDFLSWAPRETGTARDRGRRFVCGPGSFPVTLSENAQDVPGLSPLLDQLPPPESMLPAGPGEAAAACRRARAAGGLVTLLADDAVDGAVVRRIIPVEVLHNDVSSWEGLDGEIDEILQFHLVSQDVNQLNSLVKYIHERFPAGRVMLSIAGEELVPRYRLLDLMLRRLGSPIPVDAFVPRTLTRNPIALAGQLGALLADGIVQSLTIEGDVAMTGSRLFAFSVLQGAGARIFATEYVSCPGCGRTLFGLEETTRRIQDATRHLKGLKIAVMGCIVNGPGEMADADFGYVGSAPGKVDLYVGRRVVRRGVSDSEAVEALKELIREEGRWTEPGASGRAGASTPG